MCGIAGILTAGSSRDDLRSRTAAMTGSLRHRGPDADGLWISDDGAIALGHRRLSVIDLSDAGAQPMISHDGNLVMTFNGEIYNFADLRKELDAVDSIAWRGESDTEVLLEAMTRWGIEGATQRANGMFAFAVWDRRNRALTLGRDRLGEKPLYVATLGREILFASELKAIVAAAPGLNIDRESLAAFLRYGNVPAPYSIYENVWKVDPASLVRITVRSGRFTIAQSRYWDVEKIALESISKRRHHYDEQELHDLLLDAVRMRMVSDVPLGAFLSGGIDSSLIVALMQQVSSRPVKTFTIGFHEPGGFDEAAWAKKIARHIGTDHTEMYVTPAMVSDVIDRLPQIYDEPFADSSQIPTFLVSRLARQAVTVVLSGDGGDEMFGGYTRHAVARSLPLLYGALPMSVRAAASRVMRSASGESGNRFVQRFGRSSFISRRFSLFAERFSKVDRLMRAENAVDAYDRLISHLPADLEIVAGHAPRPFAVSATVRGLRSAVDQMSLLDQTTYLPNDILVKLDRASMAVSLEGRVPFLDHRLVEWSWRLSSRAKIHSGRGKWPLRRILKRYVPDAMIERPKAGFAVPLAGWLRGPLRSWAGDLLGSSRIEREGFLDAAVVGSMWDQLRRGEGDWAYALWNVVTFESWLEHSRRPELAVH